MRGRRSDYLFRVGRYADTPTAASLGTGLSVSLSRGSGGRLLESGTRREGAGWIGAGRGTAGALGAIASTGPSGSS